MKPIGGVRLRYIIQRNVLKPNTIAQKSGVKLLFQTVVQNWLVFVKWPNLPHPEELINPPISHMILICFTLHPCKNPVAPSSKFINYKWNNLHYNFWVRTKYISTVLVVSRPSGIVGFPANSPLGPEIFYYPFMKSFS